MVSFANPNFFAPRPARIGIALLACAALAFAVPAHSRAQAVWTNADDRDLGGTPPVVLYPYWSYGFVAPDQNGNGGHAGNWSGNLVPGKPGGPVDVYLGAPGNTHCDVNVALDSLTLAPGGALFMDLYSVLTVTTTNLATDGTISFGGGTGGTIPAYTNAGTFTKSAGTGTSGFDPSFVFNSVPGSTVAAASGTLQLPGGGEGVCDTAAFVPAAGATISFLPQTTAGTAYSAHFQGTLSNGTGTGTVLLSGGTMLGGSAPCTLAFTGNVFQWTGGYIGSFQGGAVYTNTGVVNISGSGTVETDATFTNNGLVTQSGTATFNVGDGNSGGSFTNAAGATYDLQSDAAIGQGGYAFNNLGLFKKSGGTGTSTLTVSFNNQGGTVEVDSGTLQMPINIGASGSTGGTFNAAAGAVLDLGDGGTFTGTFTGSGAGTVQISQGTLYTNRTTGGTFDLSGSLLQWTGGTLGGYQAGQVFANAGMMTLSGDSDKTSYDAFTNTGTMIQTGAGNFSVGSYGGGGDFTNAAGAVYDLQSDAALTSDFRNVFNAGLFEKNGGTGTSTMTALLANTGTVSVYTGTLLFSGQYTNGVADVSGGNTLTEGTWNIFDGATLDFAAYPTLTINQATVTLSGPNSSFPPINSLADNQGNFSLVAQRQFTTAGALSNEGSLSLDAGTTLHVAGAFTASGTNAALAVTVGGTATQGTASPGVLQVGGAATLAGSLAVSFASGATLPATGDTLTILSATAPVTGSFANAASGGRVTTADGKGSFLVTYGAGSASPNGVVLSEFLLPGQSALPVVSLAASVASANANEGTDGSFLISLSAAASTDLVVNLQIRGTAVNGTDYLLLKTTKKIKAGKTSKPLNIIPVDESFYAGGKKTVKVTLLPGTGYTVGNAATAKVKILYDR